MAVEPHFVNRRYFLRKKKIFVAPLLSTNLGCNEDIHPSKKHARGGSACYIQSKESRIYSESKNPNISEFLREYLNLTRCQHYSKFGTRDHYIHFIDDSYDLEYLDAYFNEDTQTVEQIEATAAAVGYGPLSKCTTVTNFSAQRVYCRESRSSYKPSFSKSYF